MGYHYSHFTRLLLRKAPKAIICFLWLFVAIRLICPFSVESVFSLIPASDPIDIDTIYSAEMVVNAGGLNTGKSAAPTLPAPISPMQLAQMILPILWAVGMMVLLIAALISYLRLRKKVSMTIPYGDHIFLCDAIPSPFILGIFCPKIYLPSGMTESQISMHLPMKKRTCPAKITYGNRWAICFSLCIGSIRCAGSGMCCFAKTLNLPVMKRSSVPWHLKKSGHIHRRCWIAASAAT